MRKINFTDKNGTFTITNPENYSGLYLPLAGLPCTSDYESLSLIHI